mmetsp:Transcript_17184/g.42666  ORF Transcript_17184/g.42666 Transcript_17184/m.42666 type:complete len:510 (+) Transcript_17184:75-1604(+)|eukprot:CAMPEP_0178981854 /NCGR_PEP_ID=MMETSP0795-20121207/173_1 /TAXON_ID=88552 /ORGANISM="Amoebophrya sp., Strain Ameob2" /LENGTH=509 /DNA_ID=CAMNT_0020672437 /DNA_START=30 /DNA_END=1559 /DNA_ORIENTATION=-
MALFASSAHYGGAARRSFVDYAKFCNLVGPLQLRTARGYFEWARSGARPVDVPSHPERYYAGKGWSSWKEALRRQSRRNVTAVGAGSIKWLTRSTDLAQEHVQAPAGAGAEQQLAADSRHVNAERACAALLEKIISDATADFEFHRLGPRSRATFLFRKKSDSETASHDEWASLSVKSRTSSNPRHKVLGFRLRRPVFHPDVGIAVVVQDQERAQDPVFGLLSPDDVKTIYDGGHLRIPRDHLCASEDTGTGRALLLARLRRLWEELPKKKVDAWFDSLSVDCRIVLYHKLAWQAAKRLYHPAGFRTDDNQYSIGCVHNIVIDGLRGIQRTATHHQPKSKAGGIEGKLTTIWRFSNGQVCELAPCAADGIDFFIFLVPAVKEEESAEQRLAGVFLFPCQFLVDQGLMHERKRGRRAWLSLYPPGSNTDTISRRKQEQLLWAERARDYYIDLPSNSITMARGKEVKNANGDGNKASCSYLDKFSKIMREVSFAANVRPSLASPACNKDVE